MRINTPSDESFQRADTKKESERSIEEKLAELELKEGLRSEKVSNVPFVNSVSNDKNTQALDLPSDYMFYEGLDAIYVRDILFREMMMISVHSQTKSFRSLAEAISATVVNADGMKITLGDWNFIMYHHRQMQNKPWLVTWTCSDKNHLAQVNDENNPLTAESLTNTVSASNSKFEIIKPQKEKLATIINEKGELLVDGKVALNNLGHPLILSPISVSTMCEITDEEEAQKNTKLAVFDHVQRAKLRSLNTLAAYIDVVPGKTNPTLKDKRFYLDEWFNKSIPNHTFHSNVIKQISLFGEASVHGVNEFVTVKCEVCGCETKVKILVDPTDFFPDL